MAFQDSDLDRYEMFLLPGSYSWIVGSTKDNTGERRGGHKRYPIILRVQNEYKVILTFCANLIVTGFLIDYFR